MDTNDTFPEPEPGDVLVAELIELLDIRPAGWDHFIGPRKKGGVGRIFGGQVIAQALVAAERTVEDGRAVHSLHAYFLRGGDENFEVEFLADRQFDGGSFSNRRVLASQNGTPILNMAVGFQKRQDGLHHQSAAMPDAPDPETLPSNDDLRRRFARHIPSKWREQMVKEGPMDIRATRIPGWMTGEKTEAAQQSWFRAKAPLPDDPRLHRAVLAYMSDYQLLGTATLPHGRSFLKGEVKMASLDHAVWFHGDFRADEWLLYTTDSPWSGGARGFNRGEIWTQDGRLVASVAQEGMIREIAPSG